MNNTTLLLDVFIDDCRDADNSDEDFESIVEAAYRLLNQDGRLTRKLATAFDVPMSTVERWRVGDNAPLPALRRPVYEWLEDEAMRAAEATRAAESEHSK